MASFIQSHFYKFSAKLSFLVIISFNVLAEDRPFIMNGFGDTPFQYIQQGLTHRGIDIRVNLGTPVIAASDGEVVWVEKRFDGRWIHPNIRIKHIDDVEVYYYHIDKIIVEHGQAVKQGQIIAYTAKTGKDCQTCPFLFTGAPHLHFETSRRSGEVFDPSELKFTCPSPDSKWWWPVGCDSYKGFIVSPPLKTEIPRQSLEPEEPLIELSQPNK
jgi:murein DD-endopeptidase MepM/ murein hydrolase activator NlpD